MDMLVPQYASSEGDRAVVSIDPSLTQNLGLRFATVTRGVFDSSLDVAGVLAFNERDVAVIQARTAGFVERPMPLLQGMCSKPMPPWRIFWCRNGSRLRQSFWP